MKISALSQKIHSFGRQGMFAYSGLTRVAHGIVKGISERLAAGEDMSEALIERELSTLSEADRTGVSFAVIYDINDDCRLFYRHRMQTFKSKALGDIYFAGSGETNLAKLLVQLDGPRSYGLSLPCGDMDGREVYAYFVSALTLAAQLTSMDLTTDQMSLKAAHGAVYDVRMLSNAGVEAPRILNAFWEVRLSENGGAQIQFMCMMLSWRDGERLRIERAVTYGEGEGQVPIGGSVSYGIRPLLSGSEEASRDVSENKPWPRQHIPYAVHYVEVFSSGARFMKAQWPEIIPVGKSSELLTLSFDESNLPVAVQVNGRKLLDGLADAISNREMKAPEEKSPH